jgi:hypothetical protein
MPPPPSPPAPAAWVHFGWAESGSSRFACRVRSQ